MNKKSHYFNFSSTSPIVLTRKLTLYFSLLFSSLSFATSSLLAVDKTGAATTISPLDAAAEAHDISSV